jgi:hypothetical protein
MTEEENATLIYLVSLSEEENARLFIYDFVIVRAEFGHHI